MTQQIEALIAGAYLAGTNTRRIKRALGAMPPEDHPLRLFPHKSRRHLCGC
jgi:hypothetical protein